MLPPSSRLMYLLWCASQRPHTIAAVGKSTWVSILRWNVLEGDKLEDWRAGRIILSGILWKKVGNEVWF